MEIYKDLSSPASQQFEKLLNNQLSKNKIEEGKLIEGKITKITEKYIFLFIPGLKSEPVLDINEMKMIGMQDKIVEGETVSVLLEKIEDKNGDVIVSAQKAKKIKGWYELERAYEENETINGKITSKCKGGVIVEHIETNSLMFWIAFLTPLPKYRLLSSSLNSKASCIPVEAPLGTAALPKDPSSKTTSHSTVGFPLLSKISLA